MNSTKIPKKEALLLTIGEITVSAITVVVYLLIKKYNYTVLLGAILGCIISVFNFIFLSISVNRAIDRAVESEEFEKLKEAAKEKEENGEEDEEDNGDAERFAKKNQMQIQNAVRLSYTVRTVSMVAALAVAFITKQFDLIATLIPLIMFRPILTVAVMLGRKES